MHLLCHTPCRPSSPLRSTQMPLRSNLYRSVTIWRGTGHPVAWERKNIEWNHDYYLWNH